MAYGVYTQGRGHRYIPNNPSPPPSNVASRGFLPQVSSQRNVLSWVIAPPPGGGSQDAVSLSKTSIPAPENLTGEAEAKFYVQVLKWVFYSQ